MGFGLVGINLFLFGFTINFGVEYCRLEFQKASKCCYCDVNKIEVYAPDSEKLCTVHLLWNNC